MSGRMQTFAAAASAFSALRQGGPSTECDFKYLPAALPEEIVLLCLLIRPKHFAPSKCFFFVMPTAFESTPRHVPKSCLWRDIARDTCPIEHNSEEEGRFRKLMFACAQMLRELPVVGPDPNEARSLHSLFLAANKLTFGDNCLLLGIKNRCSLLDP